MKTEKRWRGVLVSGLFVLVASGGQHTAALPVRARGAAWG